MGTISAPDPQQKRFAACMDGLAKAAGRADRVVPLKNYCTGLLLPGQRKSVEPMAARLAPDNVRRMRQSLHHLAADAPWSDAAVLAKVRAYALTAMRQKGPVQAWIMDDTGFVKKGIHSVGVTRQCCGQVGKQENCRTKPAIALKQVRAAVAADLPRAPVLADAAYGADTKFRQGITRLGVDIKTGASMYRDIEIDSDPVGGLTLHQDQFAVARMVDVIRYVDRDVTCWVFDPDNDLPGRKTGRPRGRQRGPYDTVHIWA